MVRAVFLDKDGTLVENRPFSVVPTNVRFFPDAFAALRLLHRAGFILVIVTNQAGVAHGHFTETHLQHVRSNMQDMLCEADIPLHGFYYCPHHPEGILTPYAIPCLCRKPSPGLLMQASRDHSIDMAASWMVGDILDDVEAGRRAGCRTVLLNNGHETEWLFTETRWPNHIARTLVQAAQIIARSGPRPSPCRPPSALHDRPKEDW